MSPGPRSAKNPRRRRGRKLAAARTPRAPFLRRTFGEVPPLPGGDAVSQAIGTLLPGTAGTVRREARVGLPHLRGGTALVPTHGSWSATGVVHPRSLSVLGFAFRCPVTPASGRRQRRTSEVDLETGAHAQRPILACDGVISEGEAHVLAARDDA